MEHALLLKRKMKPRVQPSKNLKYPKFKPLHRTYTCEYRSFVLCLALLLTHFIFSLIFTERVDSETFEIKATHEFISREIFRSPDGDVCICGLVTHFNPTQSARRHNNYRLFSQRLRQQGVFLVTIELFANEPLLDENYDSDLYKSIQVDNFTHEYPIWQKERLMNIGLELLDSPNSPVACKNVAWIDGEILFENDRWVSSTCDALENNFTAVQPYSSISLSTRKYANKLLRRGSESPLLTFSSSKKEFASNFNFKKRGNLKKEFTGYAWVAHREKLTKVKFYDRGIVGGGDSFFLSAVQNNYNLENYNTTVISAGALEVRRLMDHYKNWAKKVYPVFEGRIGFPVESKSSPIVHLWHGSLRNRQYGDRWQILSENDYDPVNDIVEDEGGFLTWSESVKESKFNLLDAVQEYFLKRLEDGSKPRSKSFIRRIISVIF